MALSEEEQLRPLEAPLLGAYKRASHVRHASAAGLALLLLGAVLTMATQPTGMQDALLFPALFRLFYGRDDYSACDRARLTVAVGQSVIDCGAAITQVLSAGSLGSDDLKQPPNIAFYSASERSFYALAVVDLDAPTPDAPSDREYRQMLIGNLVGAELKTGNITRYHELTPWETPRVKSGTGAHRIVFLLFSEYGPAVNFEAEPDSRQNWNAQQWADSYGFGPPVAASFFVLDD